MSFINSKIHGIIDYLVVIFLLASPSVFDLPEGTALFTYILGGVHLLLTVLTDFEFGVFKVIPFHIHGWIELVVSLGLGGLAFYFYTIRDVISHNFCAGFAIAVFLTWLVTGV
ncbi:MAG: hypothetical protein V4721_01910 [Bacteroidota bacterium]